MKKIVTLTIICCMAYVADYAQSIPPNTCGILYTYDNAGNRIKREYFCNNGGRVASDSSLITAAALEENAPSEKNTVFQSVEALYPNPTTGVFYVSFSKPLENAIIQLTDNNGKVVQRFKTSGNRLTMDLSGAASGVYFIQINDRGNVITKKVVKAR